MFHFMFYDKEKRIYMFFFSFFLFVCRDEKKAVLFFFHVMVRASCVPLLVIQLSIYKNKVYDYMFVGF